MKIIQICGANGTGKTTLLKGFLKRGMFFRAIYAGTGKEFWTDGETIVLGKYKDNNCSGVDNDNYKSGELEKTIEGIVIEEAPQTILFEDARYGTLFSSKERLLGIASRYGYDYCVIALQADLGLLEQRIFGRSGNPNVDYDRIIQKQRQVIKSTRKIGDCGAKTRIIDTGATSKENLLNMLLEEVYGTRQTDAGVPVVPH